MSPTPVRLDFALSQAIYVSRLRIRRRADYSTPRGRYLKTPAELTVLIVDDNLYARALAETSLKKLGIGQILEASDGAEGLELLDQYLVDLVLLDWYMPEINGAGFVRLARARNFNPAIVVMTAYATRENANRMRELDLRGVLVKPFDDAHLQKMVAELLAAQGATAFDPPARSA